MKKGQSIIELMFAIAVMSVMLPAMVVGFTSSREGRAQQKQRLIASSLMKETIEAVRSVREKGWTDFAINGNFHTQITGTSWSLGIGSTTVNGFTQLVIISDVRRDNNGIIVPTGGTIDPSTKKVNITISWTQPKNTFISSILYLSRFMGNIAVLKTTQADFNATGHVLGGTAVVKTDGSSLPDDGEVTLGSGGSSDWCQPNLLPTPVNLPKSGVANAIAAIEGQVVVGTGENASGVSFANVLISNDKPPIASIEGTFDGYKTNDVFGENDYGYLATDTNSKEIVIIDFNSYNPVTKKYGETGYFNAPGNKSAKSVYIQNNIGYTTVENNLYTFNLSSKNGSRAQLGSIGLAGTGNKVIVSGEYAYVGTSSTSKQLQIIHVANNGTTLTEVGWAKVDGIETVSLVINSTANRVFLATAESSNKKEMFIINTEEKTGSRSILASYDTNGMNPKGITVVPGNRAIIVGNSAEEYQVIKIETNDDGTINLNRCNGVNIDTGINGISSVLEADKDAYSYIITGDANAELKIIEGGPGGQFTSNGVYESAPIDSLLSTAFNRFTVNIEQPSQTNIQMQIAVASPVDNSCLNSTYTYVGPNGNTDGNCFTTPANCFTPQNNTIIGAIPFGSYPPSYQNPNRCLRYKLWLSTSDINQSPVVNDITINYSP